MSQWAKALVSGRIKLLAERKASAKQIADTCYDPASDTVREPYSGWNGNREQNRSGSELQRREPRVE